MAQQEEDLSNAPLRGLDRPALEISLAVLIGVSTALGLASGIMMLIPVTRSIGVFIGIGAAMGFVASVAWARNSPQLEALRQSARMHGARRSTLNWQTLRVSALLLNLLIIVAAIFLVLELLSAGGLDSVEEDSILTTMAASTVSIISLVLGFTVFHSLRTEYDIPVSTYRTVFSILLLAGGAILGLGAMGLISGADASFALLASMVFTSLAAFAWRELPNIYSLATEERSVYHGGKRITRTQSTLMPTLVAFGLLFIVLLLFMLFGATTVGRLQEVILQPEFLFLAAIMIIAILGSVAAVVMLGRKQEDLQLYEEHVDEKAATRRAILYVSLGLALITLIAGALIGLGIDLFGIRPGRWVDFIAIAILLGIGPYGFYVSHEHARVRRLEERFPDFLRDIASSHRGGLTLPSAVAIAAKGEYGPLTPEVERMADQLSWNVSFDEALDRFAERVSTPLVRRTVSLVREAGRSGGSTSEVLLAAARDARQLKNMENDRRLTMTLYGVIIYITFLVFLLVASVLHQQFVPQIIASSEALEAAGNVGGFSISVVTIDEYRAFYFLSSIVQGLGGGMVAGMMASGKAILGLRHATIMTFIAFVTFSLFLV